MDRLPYMRSRSRDITKTIGSFGGLNKNLVIGENEFSDMLNMSSDRFPAISTRKTRGNVEKTLTKPNGLFYKNGLSYVDGTEWYYKEKKISDVEDSEKNMVGMGAYIVLFPDKLMYNTASGELESLEASWTQGAAAAFAQITSGSVFVKITCSGIDTAFNQYDSVTISGCTNEDFNKTAVIQEKGTGYIVIAGDLSKSFTQDSGLTIKRTVPDMDHVCESENRLWGCSSSNHEIYASKLGDATNWQAFEGISTDSYAVTVGSDGDFTGCISHLGYVLFFKEDTIHKVFGNKPSNYQVSTSAPMRGVAKGMEKSMCIVNETLLYASRDNILSFDGAQPEAIGDAVKELRFKEGTAGHFDGKYYGSFKDSSGDWGIYVFDLKTRLWHKEDNLQVTHMAYGNGALYCIDAAGNLFTISGEKPEYIPWRLESGDLLEGTIDYKHVKKLQFHVEMDPETEVNLFMQYDDDPRWIKRSTYKAKVFRTHTISVIPRRCQKYRFKLEGFGRISLIAASRRAAQGSDINGRI